MYGGSDSRAHAGRARIRSRWPGLGRRGLTNIPGMLALTGRPGCSKETSPPLARFSLESLTPGVIYSNVTLARGVDQAERNLANRSTINNGGGAKAGLSRQI